MRASSPATSVLVLASMPRMPATNTKSPARVARCQVPVGLMAPSGDSVRTPAGEGGNGCCACDGAPITNAAASTNRPTTVLGPRMICLLASLTIHPHQVETGSRALGKSTSMPSLATTAARLPAIHQARRSGAGGMGRHSAPPVLRHSLLPAAFRRPSMIPLLKGLRILDLTSVILGPYATQILGDLGAEIIKVEPPEGDSMRPVAPQAAPGLSAIFANCNRNKRSVVLDLKTEAGKAALMKLIPTADAFVHNMRQEAMDKLGFTFKAVRAVNPKHRLRRRHRLRPARALRRQARLRRRDPGRLRLCRPVPDARRRAALCARASPPTRSRACTSPTRVLAALLYRERTGEAPGYVEVPMFELMAAFSLCEHLGAATFEEDGKVGYIRVHLAEPPALQDQGRLGRRAALHGAQLDQGADRDRPRRRGRDSPGSRTPPSAAGASTSSTTSWPWPCRRAPRPSGSPSSSASTFPPSRCACRRTC